MTTGPRRTTALRGPGAGGFTPPTSLAASNPCLNCGTNVQLQFCPECGQGEIDPDPTLREFLHELAEETLHWDGKLASTLRALFLRPGELTLEYLAGRRVRYISPLRLYLVCSVVYFFLAAIIPRGTPLNVTVTVGGTRDQPANSAAGAAALAEMARSDNIVIQRLGRNIPRTAAQKQAMARSAFAAIPKAMFVLLPAFAGLLAVGFRDRRRHYPQHLAFALHLHAVLFTGLALLLLRRLIPVDLVRSALSLVVYSALGAYVLLAARRVYGGAHGGVFARLLLVFAAYGAAFAATMGATFLLIVLLT